MPPVHGGDLPFLQLGRSPADGLGRLLPDRPDLDDAGVHVGFGFPGGADDRQARLSDWRARTYPRMSGMPRMVGTAMSRRYAMHGVHPLGPALVHRGAREDGQFGTSTSTVVRPTVPYRRGYGHGKPDSSPGAAPTRLPDTRVGRDPDPAQPRSLRRSMPGRRIALSCGESVILVTHCACIAWLSPEALDLGAAATSYLVVSVANGEEGTKCGRSTSSTDFPNDPIRVCSIFTLTWDSDGSRAGPSEQIPALVAFDSVLVRTSKLAIAMSGVWVYPGRIRVQRRCATTRPGRPRSLLGKCGAAPGDRHAHKNLEIDVAIPSIRPGELGGPRCGYRLRHRPCPAGPGGRTRYGLNISLYAAPLPATSDVTIAVTWSAFAVPRTETRLPGAILRNAVARVIELWPPVLAE